MNYSLRYMWSALLDIVSIPRASAAIVEHLSLQDLHPLIDVHEHALLPYHFRSVRALIWEIKYHAHPYAVSLAADIVHDRLYSILEETLGTPLLIPVPMHAQRLRKRGHNSAQLIAEQVVRSVPDVELNTRALERTRLTKPQQRLSRAKRLHNVHGSMHASAEVRGRVCIVIDDVTTTGATFNECERALKDAGAQEVICLAVAYS